VTRVHSTVQYRSCDRDCNTVALASQEFEGHIGGWVRIMKIGNIFTGFTKRFVSDPWNPSSSVEIDMNDEQSIEFGLAVSSGKYFAAATATIQDVSIAPLETESSLSVWSDFGNLFPEGYTAINVAIGKPAKQSSTIYGASASRAVDGNTNQMWSGGSVTHTNNRQGDFSDWWEVDLEELFDISEIVVYNRLDGASYRLNDYKLEVFDGTEVVYSKRIAEDSPTVQRIRLGTDVIGNRVRISQALKQPLSLAEVQVMVKVQSTKPSGGDDGTESDS